MSPAPRDELLIAPRAQRSVGLGGAVLRALAVMAVLDVALLLVVMDETPGPTPAAVQERPAALGEEKTAAAATPLITRAAVASPEPGSAVPEQLGNAPGSAQAGAATTAQAPDASAPSFDPPRPEPALAAPAPNPVPLVPAVTVPAPQAIPAVATVPAAPAETPAVERVVLPTAKPQPPAAPVAKPAARRVPHAQEAPKPAAAPARGNLVPAVAPRVLEATREPPPCKPYTADTTLAGEHRPVRGIACPDPNGGWRIITERAALD
jgi:hypothetical protein